MNFSKKLDDIRKRHTDRMSSNFDEEGKWITTKGGRHIHLNEEGEPDKGNPHVIKAMKGMTAPGKASSPGSAKASLVGGKYIDKAKNGNLKIVGGYRRKNTFSKGYLNTDYGKAEREDKCGKTIKDNTDENGNWTPEREALHSKIIDDAFEGVKKAEGQPRCVFMGGGPASGKSYVAKNLQSEFGIPANDEAVKVDPDACKQPLPEYEPKNPGPVHEESSALAKRICAISQNEGYNTLVDGTGDGSAKKMIKKIDQARAAGQVVEGRYVFMPVEDAIGLNALRDRSVDDEMLIDTHVKLAKIIPEIAPHFDNFKLAANVIGGQPKMIAHCERGGELVIDDPDMWNKLQETANYKYDSSRVAEIKAKAMSKKKGA